MSLIEIKHGAEAKSDVLNGNFDYLEDLIVSSIQGFDSRINSANNNISNITSNLATIQNSITSTNNTVSSLSSGKASTDLSNVSPNATFKATVIDWLAPNYSGLYSISSGWTSPKAGWCYFRGNQDHTSTVVVGGKTFEVSYDTGDGQSRGSLCLFVAKGTAVTSFTNIGVANFIPCKGA